MSFLSRKQGVLKMALLSGCLILGACGSDEESTTATETETGQGQFGSVSQESTTVTEIEIEQDQSSSISSLPSTTEPVITTSTTQVRSTEFSVIEKPKKTTVTPADKLVRVTDIATVVFHDCVSHKVLEDDGSIKVIKPQSCDGGSFIVVDGLTIMVASGHVSEPSMMFYKQISDLEPGERVSVAAIKVPDTDDLYTLNCDSCSLKRA